MEYKQAQGHMHLGRGQANAGGIQHGFYHIRHQAADFGRCWVRHRGRALHQHRVAHTRYLQKSHAHRLH